MSGAEDDANGAEGDGGAAGEALERLERTRRERGLADPRPGYRRMLTRLSGEDREAYREAVRRFEEELVPAVIEGRADPVAAWIRYGLRIASALADGEARAVDASGRARPVREPDDPPVGPLLLWLPDDGGSALVLAGPEEPSEAQRATVELLT